MRLKDLWKLGLICEPELEKVGYLCMAYSQLAAGTISWQCNAELSKGY